MKIKFNALTTEEMIRQGREPVEHFVVDVVVENLPNECRQELAERIGSLTNGIYSLRTTTRITAPTQEAVTLALLEAVGQKRKQAEEREEKVRRRFADRELDWSWRDATLRTLPEDKKVNFEFEREFDRDPELPGERLFLCWSKYGCGLTSFSTSSLKHYRHGLGDTPGALVISLMESTEGVAWQNEIDQLNDLEINKWAEEAIVAIKSRRRADVLNKEAALLKEEKRKAAERDLEIDLERLSVLYAEDATRLALERQGVEWEGMALTDLTRRLCAYVDVDEEVLQGECVKLRNSDRIYHYDGADLDKEESKWEIPPAEHIQWEAAMTEKLKAQPVIIPPTFPEVRSITTALRLRENTPVRLIVVEYRSFGSWAVVLP
jgi:hypothetical protein